MTKIFKSLYGRKYVIPAEYDIFVDFAPINFTKNTRQSSIPRGKLSYLAKWVPSIDVYQNDDTVTKVDRIPIVSDPERDDSELEQKCKEQTSPKNLENLDLLDCLLATSEADPDQLIGKYCLKPNSWSEGQCYDSTATASAGECSIGSAGDAFCATRESINNHFLLGFLMPSNPENCPTYEIVQVSDSEIVKSHQWSEIHPNTGASEWHCKYGISNEQFRPPYNP